jgi:hypothetical protein
MSLLRALLLVTLLFIQLLVKQGLASGTARPTIRSLPKADQPSGEDHAEIMPPEENLEALILQASFEALITVEDDSRTFSM